LPIATNVSCVANMLHTNERGILLTEHLSEDVKQIQECINNENDYQQKIIKAANWSREFTIDKFELEIQKIIKS
jgi:hypothetical protein